MISFALMCLRAVPTVKGTVTLAATLIAIDYHNDPLVDAAINAFAEVKDDVSAWLTAAPAESGRPGDCR